MRVCGSPLKVVSMTVGTGLRPTTPRATSTRQLRAVPPASSVRGARPGTIPRVPTAGLYRFLLTVVSAVLTVVSRRRYDGLSRIPATGGVLVVCNHISLADPGVLAHAVSRTGRLPRGLATAGLFRAPVLGWLFRAMGHIPVHRGAASAAEALVPAAEALRAGELLVMYPEGGISTGDQWPMPAKTGPARLALTTGVPVVPVAQWGVQRVLPPGRRWAWLSPVAAVVTRPRVRVLVGEPLVFAGDPGDDAAVRAVTGEVMDAVTELLEELRGEPCLDAASEGDRAAA